MPRQCIYILPRGKHALKQCVIIAKHGYLCHRHKQFHDRFKPKDVSPIERIEVDRTNTLLIDNLSETETETIDDLLSSDESDVYESDTESDEYSTDDDD